jgi:cytochrome P450
LNIAELDEIFGDREPAAWSYDDDLPKLFGGLVGAVLNEELRLIPPVVSIPKCTLPNSPQRLTVDCKEITVPANCVVAIDAVAVHRNPKFWPHKVIRSSQGSITTDLDEFRPERWLEKPDPEIPQGNGPTSAQSSFSAVSADGLGVDVSPDTAASMFRPVRGAYIPFSEGARACLGRRFAQVEILAALAVIFSKYSVELAVDEWATEMQVIEMSQENRREIWNKAKKEVERKLKDEMGTIITIQLRGKPVRIRICERGNELFDWKE